MNLIRATCLAVLLTPPVTSLTFAAEDLRKKIDEGNQAFAAALLKGDVDSAVSSYTDSACVIPPSADNACGKEQIKAFWTDVVNSGVKNIKIDTREVGSSGDLAYAVGTLIVTDSTDVDHASRYTLVFKKVAGEWKLHIDTWTPTR
jgi:uncharacterized protein (TIGR02246 family)